MGDSTPASSTPRVAGSPGVQFMDKKVRVCAKLWHFLNLMDATPSTGKSLKRFLQSNLNLAAFSCLELSNSKYEAPALPKHYRLLLSSLLLHKPASSSQ